MRIIKFGILALIGMVLISCKIGNRELVYMSITLTVLDEETKQPLEGIPVTVINNNFYTKPLWFLFLPIDTRSGFSRHIYKYETDNKGIVEIPKFVYPVNRYYFIDDQDIVLNLELEDIYMDINEQKDILGTKLFYDGPFFFRPIHDYKAGHIFCYTYSLNFKQYEIEKPYVTIIPKKYEITEKDKILGHTSFHVDHESITFYLEKFIEPEITTD